MATDRDAIQDEMIRANAENIRRNEDAIRRQTEALEKIRDHYFPKKTVVKGVCGFLLKVIGAVTVGAGIMETADWYWNTRQTESMARQSAAVARRLFMTENDAAGAVRFLEKAVELDGDTVRYRIALAYVKGIAALVDFFDLGRPLTVAERERVDAILAEAVFLQEAARAEPMPLVLAAQAYALRGEFEAALRAVDRAVVLAPKDVLVRVNACAIVFASGDFVAAREEIAEAARIDGSHPLVSFWQGRLAEVADRDPVAARRHYAEAVRRAPRIAIAHVALGRTLMAGPSPDLVAARAEFGKAISVAPTLRQAILLMADSYEREGNLTLAKLWLDRALRQDGPSMKALTARARMAAKTGDWLSAVADLTTAVELAPFRADLYRDRAKALSGAGREDEAVADLRTAEALTAATPSSRPEEPEPPKGPGGVRHSAR